jgi:hypothetical protein
VIALILWALLVVGGTYAVTCSAIFAVPRILIARAGAVATIFIYCSRCVSYWIGVALFPLSPIVFHGAPWWAVALLSGFAAIGLVEVLVGVFPGVLASHSAYIQEQVGQITEEVTDDQKAPAQDE